MLSIAFITLTLLAAKFTSASPIACDIEGYKSVAYAVADVSPLEDYTVNVVDTRQEEAEPGYEDQTGEDYPPEDNEPSYEYGNEDDQGVGQEHVDDYEDEPIYKRTRKSPEGPVVAPEERPILPFGLRGLPLLDDF